MTPDDAVAHNPLVEVKLTFRTRTGFRTVVVNANDAEVICFGGYAFGRYASTYGNLPVVRRIPIEPDTTSAAAAAYEEQPMFALRDESRDEEGLFPPFIGEVCIKRRDCTWWCTDDH